MSPGIAQCPLGGGGSPRENHHGSSSRVAATFPERQSWCLEKLPEATSLASSAQDERREPRATQLDGAASEARVRQNRRARGREGAGGHPARERGESAWPGARCRGAVSRAPSGSSCLGGKSSCQSRRRSQELAVAFPSRWSACEVAEVSCTCGQSFRNTWLGHHVPRYPKAFTAELTRL